VQAKVIKKQEETILSSSRELELAKTSLSFIDTQGSLQCSQQPATPAPYPEPDEFNPHPLTLFP
jgi:hypothetical protein